MPDPDRPTQIDETDAKGGSNEGVVRWVLAISLGLALIAMTFIWITGALTQDPVESEQNVERRIEAERKAGAGDGKDLADQEGLVAPGTNEQSQSPSPEVSN